MASHEFRTPLAGILTSVSLLSRYNTPETENRREKHIKTIKKSVHYLTLVLDDFLSLDKLDHNQITAKPHTFGCEDFLINTIGEIQEMLEGKYEIKYSILVVGQYFFKIEKCCAAYYLIS